MKTVIVSAAFGKKLEPISTVTWATQRNYAWRIGADFRVLRERHYSQAAPDWEKLQLRELLESYDRALWLDWDVMVRFDCPSLFEVVPESMIGAWDESVVVRRDYEGAIRAWSRKVGVLDVAFPGWYFNTGVMLVSKIHGRIFCDPPAFDSDSDLQGWLNFGVARYRTPLMDFGWQFNHTFDCPGRRLGSYVIHYSGNGTSRMEFAQIIESDLSEWKKLCQKDFGCQPP